MSKRDFIALTMTLCTWGVLSDRVDAVPVVLDFESPESVSGIEPKAGDLYLAQGVDFFTGFLSGAVSVGGTVSFSTESHMFRMYEGSNANSGDQFIGPNLGGGARDLLMVFSNPVSSVSLVPDRTFGEFPDTIRLIGLEPTGIADQYTVLAFAEIFDNLTVGPPANLLSVSLPTAFSYALFEITTEQEGFDDLTFNPVGEDVPEPGSLGSLLLGMAAALFLGRETRRRRQ